MLDGCKAKAERDSLSTVLANQRLIGILEKQKESSLIHLNQYKDEVFQVREMYKNAVAEALDWKARALSIEKGAGIISKRDSIEFSQETSLEFKIEQEIIIKCDLGQEKSDSMELSTRAAVKEEMEKYMNLLNLPIPSETYSTSFLDERHTRQSFIITEAKVRSTSEKIALDLADSRRKLEALRRF